MILPLDQPPVAHTTCHPVTSTLQHGADVHHDNDAALNIASASGHLSVVQCLVDHGANVRAQDDRALNEEGDLQRSFDHRTILGGTRRQCKCL